MMNEKSGIRYQLVIKFWIFAISLFAISLFIQIHPFSL